MRKTIDQLPKELFSTDEFNAFAASKIKRARRFHQFKLHKIHKKPNNNAIRRFHLKSNMSRELCWLEENDFQDTRLSLLYKKATSHPKKRPIVNPNNSSPKARKLTGKDLKTLLAPISNLPSEEKSEWEKLIRGLHALEQPLVDRFEAQLQRLTPLTHIEIHDMKKAIKGLRLVLPEVKDGLIWAIDNWNSISNAEKTKWTKTFLSQIRIDKETKIEISNKFKLLSPLTPEEIGEFKKELSSLKPIHRKTPERFR